MLFSRQSSLENFLKRRILPKAVDDGSLFMTLETLTTVKECQKVKHTFKWRILANKIQQELFMFV